MQKYKTKINCHNFTNYNYNGCNLGQTSELVRKEKGEHLSNKERFPFFLKYKMVPR